MNKITQKTSYPKSNNGTKNSYYTWDELLYNFYLNMIQ